MEHIRELRTRIVKAAAAILIGGILGFIFRNHIIGILEHQVCDDMSINGIGKGTRQCPNGVLTISGPTTGITLAFKIALFSGIVLASPVWLYQLWAFLAPGLYKREKKYGLTFIGAAVPLFLLGGYCAYFFLSAIMKALLGFNPTGVAAQLPVDTFLNFVLRMISVFGVSFVLPLILVVFNFIGVLSGKRMAKHWRVVVLIIFVFAAIAVPTGDPIGMTVLAAPICVLYFGAVAIAMGNDRRRAARRAADPLANLSPDEASELDLSPVPVEQAGSIERASSLEDIS